MVYWNSTIYITPTGQPISALPLVNGVLSSTPSAQTPPVDAGHSPIISANGETTGILWQLTGGSLTAYNATNLKKLWGSGRIVTLPHFANEVVANGKVYVGTINGLVAYGLLP